MPQPHNTYMKLYSCMLQLSRLAYLGLASLPEKGVSAQW